MRKLNEVTNHVNKGFAHSCKVLGALRHKVKMIKSTFQMSALKHCSLDKRHQKREVQTDFFQVHSSVGL